MSLSATPGWQSEIAGRMRDHFVLKLVGTTLFTTIFFIAYFHLLRHPAGPPMQMPLTSLDRWVPFQPATLFAYLSLWFYIGIAPGLKHGLAELMVYGTWTVALCVAGLAVFYFWPTAVPPSGIDLTAHFGFALLQGVDAAGNAFPSMHVAIALFSALHVEQVLRRIGVPAGWRVLNAVWFVAIAWSTLAIRQHVALDVLGGLVLGAAFALPSLRWSPRTLQLSSTAPRRDAAPAPVND